MLFKKLSALVLSLFLTIATLPAVEGAPPSTPPIFQPLHGCSEFYYESNYPDEDLRFSSDTRNNCSEGLYIGGKVRDMLHDRPYSKRGPDLYRQAWVFHQVIPFLDRYGLYDLVPLGGQKAISLSKLPFAVLKLDGIYSLLDCARYYSKTGRPEYGDGIYHNLMAHLWPNGESREISVMLLNAHAKYLAAQGKEKEASLAKKAYVAASTPLGAPQGYYSEDDWVTFTTEWKPAEQAWNAITHKDYSTADEIIAGLIKDERIKLTHTPESLSRLIRLAELYRRQGSKQQAQSILEPLVDCTSEQMMLNVRLYLFSELFLLQPEESQSEHTAWANLESVAKQVAEFCPPFTTAETYNAIRPEERLVRQLDDLAVAYDSNDEPAKALRVLETTLAYHPSVVSDDCMAHLTLFETQVGDYAAAKKYLAQSIPVHSQFTAPISRAIDTCNRAGKLKDGKEMANILVEIQTKTVEALPAIPVRGVGGQTPDEIRELRTIQLRQDMSSIRFSLGQSQIQEGKFAEAEKTLRLVDEHGAEVDQQRPQYILALGQSLEGQKKYDEAIALYLSCHDFYEGYAPVIQRLITVLPHKPNLVSQERADLLEMLRHALYPSQGKKSLDLIQTVLRDSHLVNWDENELQTLRDMLAQEYKGRGKVR